MMKVERGDRLEYEIEPWGLSVSFKNYAWISLSPPLSFCVPIFRLSLLLSPYPYPYPPFFWLSLYLILSATLLQHRTDIHFHPLFSTHSHQPNNQQTPTNDNILHSMKLYLGISAAILLAVTQAAALLKPDEMLKYVIPFVNLYTHFPVQIDPAHQLSYLFPFFLSTGSR